MVNVASPHRLVAALGAFVLIALIGCGGDRGDNGGSNGSTNSSYKFSSDDLACDDSLDITIKSGTFPAGSTVTFESQGVNGSFDGSAVPIENGTTLVCGFPANAPFGGYNVLLNGTKIGAVDNGCKPHL